MEELLVAITRGLVDQPDAVTVEVDQPDEEGVIVYHLHVAESDMGRVIGKQGRIAKAIRVVMRAAATRCDEKMRWRLTDQKRKQKGPVHRHRPFFSVYKSFRTARCIRWL